MSNGMTPLYIGFGAASYDFTNSQWGHLAKKGNKWYENIAYTFGALANLSDVVSLFSGGGEDIIANSAKTSKNDWWGHHSMTKKNGNKLVSVGPSSPVETADPLTGNKYSLSKIYKNSIKSANLNWDTYFSDAGTFKVQLNNVSNKILTNYSSSRWDLLFYSCTSHSAKSLWMAGVPNLFGFHPHLLNAQLLVRQVGISSSPYLY